MDETPSFQISKGIKIRSLDKWIQGKSMIFPIKTGFSQKIGFSLIVQDFIFFNQDFLIDVKFASGIKNINLVFFYPYTDVC